MTVSDPSFHIVLHEPEIPQNTGNIGRTCLAIGAKLWLVRPLGFRLDDHHLRRAGLDYWQDLAWEVVDDWQALAAVLPPERHWYFSAHARRPHWDASYTQGAVLVFGSETRGLPDAICDREQPRAVRIPTTDAVRSLNLSNAVAIAAYEALRQVDRASAGGLGGFPTR